MNNLHTEENFIRYYYGETDLFETMEIDFQLTDDINSNLEYSIFSDQMQLLDTVSYNPSQNSLDNILAHSKKTALA